MEMNQALKVDKIWKFNHFPMTWTSYYLITNSLYIDLEVICNENEFECSVECCLLQWNKNTNYGDLENRFDYIICADWYSFF
jgi:hypothetical protein